MENLAIGRGQVDASDFDALIGPYLEAGYRVALAMLGNPDDARDAVQEAALKAWRKLDQLRPNTSARPWFLAIVANQCRDVRRAAWWSVIRVPALHSVEPDPAQTERTDIERSLAKLPRSERLALILYFYLDLPLDEVGAVLGVSAAGAKTRVYRAAKKLRPGLEVD